MNKFLKKLNEALNDTQAEVSVLRDDSKFIHNQNNVLVKWFEDILNGEIEVKDIDFDKANIDLQKKKDKYHLRNMSIVFDEDVLGIKY